MNSTSPKAYKTTTYVLAAVTLLILALTWFINELHENYTSANPRIHWLQENYLTIIIATMLISIAAGYTLSTYAYNQLARTTKKTKELKELLYYFLDAEEKQILSYLLSHEGSGSQADISRLKNMTRVKAHRTLHSMQDKELIDIQKHGKVNYIHLADNIKELLS